MWHVGVLPCKTSETKGGKVHYLPYLLNLLPSLYSALQNGFCSALFPGPSAPASETHATEKREVDDSE